MTSLGRLKPADFAPALGGAGHGEAYLEISESTALRLEDSRIEDIAVSTEQGVGLRYLKRGGRNIETVFGSANRLDAEEARSLSRALLPSRPEGGPILPETLSLYRHSFRVDPRSVPLADKISLLRQADRVIRSEFSGIRQVTAVYGERAKEFAVLDSEGGAAGESRVTVMFSVTVVAEKDGILQTGNAMVGALRGYEILLDQDPLAAARLAARRAVAKLSAPKAKAGEFPVVLANSAGGTFIHEAIGHSLEADHVQEGSSPAYVGKIGAQIAPEFLSVIDDPTLPFQRGSFRFDDEGVPARATKLVDNGVLKDFLYDRVTSMQDGKSPNGHGRRESFHSRPIPRMSNLYIAPGPHDPAQILKELKAGVLVTRMGGGQVNTATGEFVFEVDEGFWVEDGKIRHMIRDANLLGVGPETLSSISRLGWDIGWGIGTCGKDGQGVPVSDAQPTMLLPKILIGGRHD